MTDDIVTFIKIRLHEDQVAAQDALKDWPPGDEIAGQVDSILVGAHVHRQNPQRALRGVKAKRRIVDDFWFAGGIAEVRDEQGIVIAGGSDAVNSVLLLLASEWDTHPDFRPEWTL